MIYLDTSAAVKLVRPEAHSIDLSSWLRERLDIGVISSVLIEVELMRATRRSAPDRLGRAVDVLLGIGVVTVSPAVIARAAAYADPELRSLDSLHLATAEHLLAVAREPLHAFVAYDERLLGAARGRGLAVAAPGAI